MVKITCDRCGKEMEMNVDFLGNPFPSCNESEWTPTIMLSGKDPETGRIRKFDLCKNCEEELYTFIFDEVVKNG